jgi:hypothetical protein
MTGLGSRTASHNGRLTADGKYSILGVSSAWGRGVDAAVEI